MRHFFYCGALAFLLAAVFGVLLIPMLQSLKIGQNIREEGPQWHQGKAGTPTMGGVIFIVASVIAALIFSYSRDVILILLCALLFGLVGFTDDYIKVVKKRNLGLTASQKISAQLLIAAAYALFSMFFGGASYEVMIPFTESTVNFGLWYLPFAIFVMVGTVNSVNLTDGLDGLASFISLVVSLFFVLVAKNKGYEGIALVCTALAGALVGFLIYNAHPARVFMGDTGSLFIGGFLSAVAIRMGLEITLIICGGVFVIETISVILQVASFKLTGKRIFKMSPIHHHFELSGFRETSIVALFTAVTLILCVVAYIGIY